MRDDYLYDGSGTPDPEIAQLEDLLADLKYDGDPPRMPESTPAGQANGRGWFLFAAAAMILIGLGAWALRDDRPTTPGWRCGDDCELLAGQWLETGEQGTVVEVADIGDMVVSPRTRLQLVATGEDEHRLNLARGHIRASVIAPPRLLIVETPAATAVDLGCEYDLTVGEDGSGLLEVHTGAVALELPRRVVTVPAGAKARMRVGFGPGTPYFADASPDFTGALEGLDFAGGADADLQLALSTARPRDTLSLFHLIPPAHPSDRPKIFDRIRALTPYVNWAVIDADAVTALDPEATALLLELIETTW